MANFKVAKFGGTSMGSYSTMNACADLIKSKGDINVIVVSATSGTTNSLIELASEAASGNWQKASFLIDEIKFKHNKFLDQADVNESVRQEIKAIFEEIMALSKGMYYLREISPKGYDRLLGTGERISSIIFREILKKKKFDKNVIIFDARKIIITDSKFGSAEPIPELIKQNSEDELIPLLKNNIVVTQGFIGKSKNGDNTVLGRGGSDYTATLIGEAIDASEVQIWTDVSGVATADPRIVKDISFIPELNYTEAAELANSGAKVLHPQTLLPAMRKNIPVFVGNSFSNSDKGTWIKEETVNKPLIRAVSIKRNQSIVTINSLKMVEAYGFLQNIFAIFAKYKLSIDLITTSEVSVSLTLNEPGLLSDEIIEELENYASVTIENGFSQISIIGNGILTTSGVSSKTFAAIEKYNVRMICFGASRHNFTFLVNEEHGHDIVRILHKIFLES